MIKANLSGKGLEARLELYRREGGRVNKQLNYNQTATRVTTLKVYTALTTIADHNDIRHSPIELTTANSQHEVDACFS
jgi:predicted lactoylglutathione lyase